MMPIELQQTVRSILDELAQERFESLVARVASSRLTANQLRKVIRDYGRTVISPPAAVEEELDVVQVRGANPSTWSVRAPLWTREEGRSDLTLELTVMIDGTNTKVELDDRARWYNLDGRFVSFDVFYDGALEDPVSLHKYQYARNNPTIYIDPSGKISVVEIGVTFGVNATINGVISYATGERNPLKIITNAAISGVLGVLTGGAFNAISTRVASVFVRSMGFAALGGALGFAQSVADQLIFNKPDEPINWEKAVASGIVSAIFAGLFNQIAGDRYDGGDLTSDQARQLYDLCAGVGAELFGSVTTDLYDKVREIIKERQAA